MSSNICPKTWMLESILVIVLCCSPLGIVGLINASKVEQLYIKGQYEQAMYYSKQAKKWVLLGIPFALIYFILVIICNIIIFKLNLNI